MTNKEKMGRAIKALEDIFDACGWIKDAGACDKCPFKYTCIEETTVEKFIDETTKWSLEEAFDLAADIGDYISDEDYIYDLADRQRKGERDEFYD